MIKAKYLTFIAIASAILFLTSCGTNRQLTSNRKPSEINKLAIINPLARIDVIEKGNSGEYSKTESEKVAADILDILDKNLPNTVQKNRIKIDSSDLLALQKEMFALVVSVEQKQKINDVFLSEKMLLLMGKYEQDYVLGVFEQGFTRVKGNYGKQIAKGIGIGILTLGLVIPTPVKSSSTLICFIADRKNKNIAFYRKDVGSESNPTDKKVLSRQIKGTIGYYFSVAN